MPKVQNSVNIAMLFESEEYFDIDTLDKKVKAIYELYSGDISDIENQDNNFDFKFAYSMAVEKIKANGGRCSSEEIRKYYETAKLKLEEYKKALRHDNRSPFVIYPKDSKESPDEIYLNLTNKLDLDLQDALKTSNFEQIYRIVALQKVYRDLLDIANDPDKIKDMEQVNFDVNPTATSKDYIGIGLCDLEYTRTKNLRDVMTLENSLGDVINVTEIGRMGFSLMRRPEGPLYQDNITIYEYVITKTYYSRENANEPPEQRSFRIFSKTIIPDRIQNTPEIYSIYADQIFSDYSLETAQENNGGFIASADMIRDKSGRLIPEIAFEKNSLAACIALEKVYKEYLTEEKKSGLGRRITITRGKEGAIVGNVPNVRIRKLPEIRLKNGYATCLFRRANGETTEEKDDILAFQWSDIEKENHLNKYIREVAKKSGEGEYEGR